METITKLEITYIPLSELKPYENNPRIISEAAIHAVADSIQKFGFLVPIVITDDNVIVAGHTRFEAALYLNYEEVPCIRTSGLTVAQIQAFRLIDNRSGELSDWDFTKLLEEIQNLPDIDLSAFNFESLFDRLEEETAQGLESEVFEYVDEQLAGKSGKKNADLTCPECGHTAKKSEFMVDDPDNDS